MHLTIRQQLNHPQSHLLHLEMSLQELVQKFQFERLLESDSRTKQIVLLGTIENQPAIIRFERAHFNLDTLSQLTSQTIRDTVQTGNNDIYQWGLGTIFSSLPESADVKINIIYPATETHINKYAHQDLHLVTETPQMYSTVVEPFIRTQTGDRLKWVRNILFEGAEAESIVYREDGEDGFVLTPDMKWDGTSMDQLYLTAIVNKGTEIRSVRDLNRSHIEWLTTMGETIRSVISKRYEGIERNQLRFFVHYHPSYYHLHIHCVNVLHPGLGDSIGAGKAILLEDVIDQLHWLGEEGFRKKTMTYVIGENHKLWKLLNASDLPESS